MRDGSSPGDGARSHGVPAGQGAAAPRPEGTPLREAGTYLVAAGVVALTTFVASAARAVFRIPDAEMLFLLAVTIVAVTSRRGPAIVAAVLSVAAYDFFFVPPSLTFDVADARYVLTFAMMLGIGILISTLTHRLREQQAAAVAREQRTSALYGVSRRLGAALDERDVARVCVGAVAEVLGAPSFLLAPRPGDALEPLAASPGSDPPSSDELAVARWVLLHGSTAGRGTDAFDEAPVLCIAMRPVVEVLGVLAVREPPGGMRPDQHAFADAVCRQGALALERVRLAAEARQAALRVEAEELRSGLLSAVSHDLRTPLAAITGAATTLRDDGGLDAETRRDLVEAVCEEADRLERLVANLLDMTRLQSGAVKPRREWVPAVEVIGSALTRLERRLADRPVTTEIPDDLPLLPVDPVLLEQLLLNLLDNATKYTPAGSPIDVSASAADGAVAIEVADRGPGIPPGDEERVFERFRRGAHGDVAGAGLGLAIARAIAIAHGGTLAATPRPGGGAVFRLTLPLLDRPPPGGGEATA